MRQYFNVNFVLPFSAGLTSTTGDFLRNVLVHMAQMQDIVNGNVTRYPTAVQHSAALIEDERADLLACNSNAALKKLITNRWDSALFDVLPQAISFYLQRPLHILSCCGSGEIWEQVVSCQVDDAIPIFLVRTMELVKFDHYEAVL